MVKRSLAQGLTDLLVGGVGVALIILALIVMVVRSYPIQATVTALGYEQHCASILFRSGWTVHLTAATGDHGADVIAEKDGQRLVVQCKLYAQPVGNKAVQEVYSARPLYNCDHACVVAPAGFTAQAQRAAHSLSVRLLHHDQLHSFADELVPGGIARVRWQSAQQGGRLT